LPIIKQENQCQNQNQKTHGGTDLEDIFLTSFSTFTFGVKGGAKGVVLLNNQGEVKDKYRANQNLNRTYTALSNIN